MRVLAIDPGAERCGWAVLEPGPTYIASGLLQCPREKRAFQHYRCYLEQFAWDAFEFLMEEYLPNKAVNEIIPPVGFNNSIQSYLANTVVTTFHLSAFEHFVPTDQISARTMQKQIAIKGRGKKVTKPQVRNGVIKLLPELAPRVSEWVKVFDEPDAIANGLAWLGYTS